MAPKLDAAVRLAASGLCRSCNVTARPSLATRLGRSTSTAVAAVAAASSGRRMHSSLLNKTQPTSTAQSSSAVRTLSSSAPHGREMLASIPADQLPKPKLEADNLFHSFSDSPIAEIRQRAEFIKTRAFCPEHSHRPMWAPTMAPQAEDQVKEPGTAEPQHPGFECPDCGIPVYCNEQHWMEDYENHMKVCDTLRQINEDTHDLHSGRAFPEFAYSGVQIREAVVNMSDWDNYMYSRDFEAVNSDRSMRHITRLLTYPVTVGSVLHELSPYTVGKDSRLTNEGLKSMSALRYSLHPPKRSGEKVKDLKLNPPAMRIFVLGARAESSLPREAWTELSHLFPDTRLHVIMIGPEAMANRDDEFPLPPRTPSNPYGAIVEDRIWTNLKISTIVDYYHTIHKTGYFEPYDPYFDCFVLFHPGLGYPTTSPEWAETIPQLLETKLPIICTGYTQYDMERDIEWVNKTAKGEFDILLKPGENKFRSLGWEMNDLDPKDVHCRNWGVWAFRGKRYEATVKEDGTIALSSALMASITPIRNPGRIRSPELSTPVSRTPPRRTSTPTIGANSNTAAPSSAGQTRRSTRTSDPLGERATVQLIRRVLLPSQHSDGLTAAGLQSQLPPLTSSNELDLQVYALLAIILRDYVQAWYSRITPDDEFVGEIVQIMAHITTAMEQRVRKVDWESVLLDEIPELLEQHVLAYRTAKKPATRPPLQANAREIYHALFPLPAMAPVPEAGDSTETAAAQKANEAAYRKLLVQGMLALLLPSDDLQNPCLTALVGEILSETIIGNLVANKLAQPWMLWEILAIVADTLTGKRQQQQQQQQHHHQQQQQQQQQEQQQQQQKKKKPVAVATQQDKTHSRKQEKKKEPTPSSPITLPPVRSSRWSFQGLIVMLVQLGITIYSAIRGVVLAVVQAQKLPSRKSSSRAKGDEKAPVATFRLFSFASVLIELDERMPWLSGNLAMVQWMLLRGPWQVGAVDGVLDRYISNIITRALDGARMPQLIKSIRGSVFPNNMPGKGSLSPPENAAQERALRLKTASALAALVPMWMLRVYFCGGVWRQFDGDDDEGDTDQRVLDEIDSTVVEVFADEYCNRHLIYSIVELIFVRLMPELAEKGVEDLFSDRLGV